MRIKNTILLVLLSIILGIWNGIAQKYTKALDGCVRELSESTVGGTVLVAKKGKEIYKTSFGMANLELEVVMQPKHVLRIGSLTKQFTAAAILKLEEEGKLSLQDDIIKYIKGYPNQGNKITIAHLLSHTSGIANYTDMPKLKGNIRRKDLTPDEITAIFQRAPMDFAPGEGFKYSNSGYVLLGKIIEKVSRTTYADYLEKTFFEPLGMDRTGYDDTSMVVPDRVPGYDLGKGGVINTDYLSMTIPYAGGALLSNIDDLLIWNNAIMEHKILGSKAVEKAHTPFVLQNGETINYGLGWRLGNIQGSASIKHGGSVNGFTSFALYLPEEEVFVAILTNCSCTTQIENIASKMAAVVMGSPFELGSVEVLPRDLRPLQGEYRSDKGILRTIRLEDDKLFYFEKGGEKNMLIPLGGKRFRLKGTLATLDFGKSLKNGSQGFVTYSLYSPIHWKRIETEISGYTILPLSKRKLKKYTGDYRFPNGKVFKVIEVDGTVYGQMGSNKEEIRYMGEGRFYAVGIDAQLVFSFGSDGQVNELSIVQKNKKKAVRVQRK